MLILGVQIDGLRIAKAPVFDLLSKSQCSSLPNLPEKVYWFSGVIMEPSLFFWNITADQKQLYFFSSSPFYCGGTFFNGSKATDSCYILSSNTWVKAPSLLLPRSQFTMNFLPFSDQQRNLLIVGKYSDFVSLIFIHFCYQEIF